MRTNLVAHKAYQKLWYRRNRKRLLAKQKARYLADPAPAKARIKAWGKSNLERVHKYKKTYKLKNRHKATEYERLRRLHDPEYRLLTCLRARVRQAVKVGTKSASTLDLLGCTIPELRLYLEAKFQPGMAWENYGRQPGKICWEIDHRRPCAAFDLVEPSQQRACFHWSNLQPLWRADNLIKGAQMA